MPPQKLLIDHMLTPSSTAAPRSSMPPSTVRVKSKTLFTDIATASSAWEARYMTASVLSMWNGTSLHPLTAIRALSLFPIAFHDAVSFIFEAVHKSSDAMTCTCKAYWRSIQKRRGYASRYFKAFDKALQQVVATKWYHVLKQGRELDIDPVEIAHRITACWDDLLKRYPCPPLRTKTGIMIYQPGDVHIFERTRHTLSAMLSRRLAVLKTNRILGDTLPPELLGQITDNLSHRAYHLFHASTNMIRWGSSRKAVLRLDQFGSVEELLVTIAKGLGLGVSFVKLALWTFRPHWIRAVEEYFAKMQKDKLVVEGQ